MKNSCLLYFCDNLGSVFDSQVIRLLRSINEQSVFKKIYLFLGFRNEVEKGNYLTKKIPPGVDTVFYKTYPNYLLFNLLSRWSIKSALLKQNIDLKMAILHTRGEMIAWHLSKIPGSNNQGNIIPDIRGASIEEVEEFYGINRILKSLKINANKKAVKRLNKFKRISVVSNSLGKYLITNYGIDPGKMSITPCLAGDDFRFDISIRNKTRKELNLISDETLIVFSSGGTANWQNNDLLMILAQKGLKVLNLSKKEINHKNIINKFVDYSQISAYLNAADIAIIWRDISVVNKVASPVKFSEYICCGLPVIANNSVDMISEYINNYECGLLIDNIDDLDEIKLKELKQKDRNKISKEGILNFGVKNIVDKYFQLYSSIKSL